MEKERDAVEDVEIGRSITFPSACDVKVRGSETTGMVRKHMIEVEGYRIAKERV